MASKRSSSRSSRSNSRKPSRKSQHQNRRTEQHDGKLSDAISRATASPVPATVLLAPSSRSSPFSRRNAVISIEDIKNRALRTEELTQRAHRFNYQLAIDLREILQAEFDILENKSADPKVTITDLKVALLALSNKITSEMDKQMDVQKKIAEAYESMYQEAAKMAKQVLTELDTARLAVDGTAATCQLSPPTRQINDVLNVIRETADYWVALPEVSHKRLNDLKRDAPKDSMNLDDMYEHLEFQIKHCHKALEHPMAGVISISKEFAKLNIYRKLQ